MLPKVLERQEVLLEMLEEVLEQLDKQDRRLDVLMQLNQEALRLLKSVEHGMGKIEAPSKHLAPIKEGEGVLLFLYLWQKSAVSASTASYPIMKWDSFQKP